MTPKEKAKELVNKFNRQITKDLADGDWAIEHIIKYFHYTAKQCALIAVDELLDSYTKEKSHGYIISDKIIPYWKEVKQEIEKL